MLTRPMLVLSAVLFALSSFPRTAVADPLAVPSGYLFVNNDPVTGFGIDLRFVGDDFVYVGEAFVETRNFLEGFSRSSSGCSFLPTRSSTPARIVHALAAATQAI